MKFGTKKEKFKLNTTESEGLSGNKISLKGNKKKSSNDSFSLLNMDSTPKSDFDDVFDSIVNNEYDTPPPKFKKKKKKKTKSKPVLNPIYESPPSPEPYSEPEDYSSDEDEPEPFSPAFDYPPELSDDDTKSIMSGLSSVSSYPLDEGLKKMKRTRRREKTSSNPFGLSDDDMDLAEKQDLLNRFHILKSGGTKLTKNYTIKSSLSELRMEMGRIEHDREKGYAMLKLRRQTLAFCGGAEKLIGSRIVPKVARGRLNGFSEFVLDNLNEYDPVFEKLSERYGGFLGGGSTGNPILDLAIVMGSQIMMFMIMQYTSSSREPTEDEIRQKYPGLVKRVGMEEAEKMRQNTPMPYQHQHSPPPTHMSPPPPPPPIYTPPPPPPMEPSLDVYDLRKPKSAFPVPKTPAKSKPSMPLPSNPSTIKLSNIDISGFSSAPLPGYTEILPERGNASPKTINGGDEAPLKTSKRVKL